MLRSQLQASREKIDDKITGILQSNNIVLGADETLNLKVNQRGKITVGDGVSADKREKIEKLLNEDKTLAKDLLFTHAQRKFAVSGDGNTWGTGATNYILADTILQREYGVSLDDFQVSKGDRDARNEDGELVNWRSIVSKDGNNDLLDKIHNEERFLYSRITEALRNREENGEDFEISFAYKNGVTIEKGATDQASLDEAARKFTLAAPFTEYSVTLDPSGKVLNSQASKMFAGSRLDMTRSLNDLLRWMERDDSAFNNSALPTPSRLQQYAFDAQRLFQFNTGVDAETAKSMNVTFGNAK
jgi:hypothetical protein